MKKADAAPARGTKRPSAGAAGGKGAPQAAAACIDELFAAIPKKAAKAPRAEAPAAPAAGGAGGRGPRKAAPAAADAPARGESARREKAFFLDNGEPVVPVRHACSAWCHAMHFALRCMPHR